MGASAQKWQLSFIISEALQYYTSVCGTHDHTAFVETGHDSVYLVPSGCILYGSIVVCVCGENGFGLLTADV